jgi:formate dehydrogenase maturation protein FdhE
MSEMTDDAAVEAARTVVESVRLPALLNFEDSWSLYINRLTQAIAAHTEAALKEKAAELIAYEKEVSDASYREQAVIEGLRAQLAAAEGKYHDAMEILTRWGNLDLAEAVGKLIETEHERDALTAELERKQMCPACGEETIAGETIAALTAASEQARLEVQRLHAGGPPVGFGSLMHVPCRTCTDAARAALTASATPETK